MPCKSHGDHKLSCFCGSTPLVRLIAFTAYGHMVLRKAASIIYATKCLLLLPSSTATLRDRNVRANGVYTL